MINVIIERSSRTNRIHSFTLSGHAESGPYGYDLVCAAVSALSIGAVNAVAALCDVKLPTKAGRKGGYLHCEIPCDLAQSTDEKVQLLIEGMIVSLQSIADEYSEHILLIENKS